MTVEKIRDEGQTLGSPLGKVLGIVDSQAAFDTVAQALKAAGFPKIQSLAGDEGVSLLERVDSFFFSDMEDRVLARHLEELQAGHLVISVETPSDRVKDVERIATENGARLLVHFGWATVTWLTR